MNCVAIELIANTLRLNLKKFTLAIYNYAKYYLI